MAAGCLVAAALPPWGLWPAAFVGVALIDRLLADRPPASRFRRMWLVAAAWLYTSWFWMLDLSIPGYLFAVAVHATFFGLAALATPPGPGRRLALPGTIVLAEAVRSAWPFGGVPISTLAIGQADGPLAPVVRLGGSLLLGGLVVVIGVGLSAALDRSWRPVVTSAAITVAVLVAAAVAPRGHAVDSLDVALVQGGGPQNTRAADTDEREVFERHLEASELIEGPVDLVLWPEDVVDVEGPIEGSAEGARLADLARELDATLVVGVVEGEGEDAFRNAAVVFDPDGRIVDRYEKVNLVPFGEYVPLRGLVSPLSGGSVDRLIPREAIAGEGPPVVDSPVGRLGVAISWEVFLARSVRDSVNDGGQVVLNPTNGASYWLTMLQSQQIATSRLRALENDRWVLQAAPTGFTAIVTPDGEVVERTGVSEQRVLQGTVELREGTTLATRYGDWPVLVLALAALAAGWAVERRRSLTPPRGASPAHR